MCISVRWIRFRSNCPTGILCVCPSRQPTHEMLDRLFCLVPNTNAQWSFPTCDDDRVQNANKSFQALLQFSKFISGCMDAMQGRLPATMTAFTEGVISAHHPALQCHRSLVTVCRHLSSSCAFRHFMLHLHITAAQLVAARVQEQHQSAKCSYEHRTAASICLS